MDGVQTGVADLIYYGNAAISRPLPNGAMPCPLLWSVGAVEFPIRLSAQVEQVRFRAELGPAFNRTLERADASTGKQVPQTVVRACLAEPDLEDGPRQVTNPQGGEIGTCLLRSKACDHA